MTSEKTSDKIPFKEQLAYGVGALMDGGGVALMSCILTKYMSDGLGISIGVATTIYTVSRLWDAVSDPMMGAISDRTRSKYGRRRPYLFVGGISVLIALLLLFAPLESMGITGNGQKIAWMLVMYLIYNTASTVSQVPYCSLSSDISPDYKERNKANTVKLVFSAAGSGLAYVVPLLVLGMFTKENGISDVSFWLIIALGFGILFGGGLVVCSLFVKERVTAPEGAEQQKFDLKKFVSEPFKIKSFRWHLVMYVCVLMCSDMLSALAAYYADNVWHGHKPFGLMEFSSMFIVAPLMVSAVVSFPLIYRLMNKKGKAVAFRLGLPLYILGGILLAVLDPKWCPVEVIPFVALIMGVGFAGAQMMPWIIFPDAVDVAELKLGERNTGNFSGMMTLMRKVAGALAIGSIGWILKPIGYQSSTAGEVVQQSENVVLAIRLLMGVSVAVLIAIALFASFKYKVTSQKLDRVRYFNEKRKSGEDLTADEAAEKEALLTELA